MKKFLFIGHRGTRKNYDENTLGAFSRAIKYGADYIEFDIRKTKDNCLIVIHDASIDRTTNGSGLVENLQYREILQYRTKKDREKIPLLTDIFAQFTGKVKFMIELKGKNVMDRLLDIAEIPFLTKECVVSGRRLSDLKKLKSEIPNGKICYNVTKGIGLSLKEFLELGTRKQLPLQFEMVSLRSSLIDSKFVEVCHENNIMALSWDFLNYDDPVKEMKTLIGLGIDGLLFDDYKNILTMKERVHKGLTK